MRKTLKSDLFVQSNKVQVHVGIEWLNKEKHVTTETPKDAPTVLRMQATHVLLKRELCRDVLREPVAILSDNQEKIVIMEIEQDALAAKSTSAILALAISEL